MRFSFVADHFQYLASVGPICLAAALLTECSARILPGEPRWARRFAPWAVIVPLVGLSFRRCHVYRDFETLLRDTLAQNPTCWMAHGNLAGMLAQRGQFDEAFVHAKLRFDARPDLASSYCGYAQVLAMAGRKVEAEHYFRQGLSIDPWHFRTTWEYANLLLGLERYAEALPLLEESIRQKPGFPLVHQKLALACSMTGRHDRAIRHYQQAIKMEPASAELMWGLSRAFHESGQTETAIATLGETIRLFPRYAMAYSDLGGLLGGQGRVQEAIACLREALALKADDSVARYNLACLLDNSGAVKEAVVHYREVLMTHPNDQEAQKRLDAALVRLGASDATSQP
jgi:tetratricopeptide (TPR) repeat protein